MLIDETVNTFPFPQHRVDASSLRNGLVGTGGADLEGGAAVKPAIGATKSGALGIYHAHVIGGEGLAKGAAIVGVHRFIGHTCYPGIPLMINAASLVPQFFNLIQLGVKGNLHLVHDGAEIVVKVGMQDDAKVFQAEALIHGRFTEAEPGNVPLRYMLYAFSAVDEVVDLALQNRLEVLLHLSTCYRHHDAQGHFHPLLKAVEVRPDNGDLAILNLIHILHRQPFKASATLAPSLSTEVLTANHLALKGRAKGNGNVNLGDLDLDPSHLDAALYQPLRPLHIILSRDVIERHADHMLIFGDTRRQDIGHHGIADGGEAVGDGPGTSSPLEVIHGTQAQGEGETAELVIEQHLAPVAGLDIAEAEGSTAGKTGGIDHRLGVGTVGDGEGVVSQIHPLLQ